MYRPSVRAPRHLLRRPATLGPAGLPATRPRQTRTAPPAWQSGSRGWLVLADAGCAELATVAGFASPFAPAPSVLGLLSPPVMWVSALLAARCYDGSATEGTPDHVRRILAAAALLLGGVALLAWGWNVDVPRGWVALTLPLTAGLSLAARTLRQRLVSHSPASGRAARTVLLVGDRPAAARMQEQFARSGAEGTRVVGYCLSTHPGLASPVAGLPALGGLTDVAEVARRYSVDTVVVLPSTSLDGAAMQHLAGQADASGCDLLIASVIADMIGSRRARVRSVGGLRMLQVGPLRTRGPRGAAGAMWDRLAAGLLVVLVAPVLLAISLAVALDSPGPILVRGFRTGCDGRDPSRLRFRAALSGREGDLTRVGTLLRRRCLDELPALIDVVRGDRPLPALFPLRRGRGAMATGDPQSAGDGT